MICDFNQKPQDIDANIKHGIICNNINTSFETNLLKHKRDIDTLENILNEYGEGTYIINACREVDSSLSIEQLETVSKLLNVDVSELIMKHINLLCCKNDCQSKKTYFCNQCY